MAGARSEAPPPPAFLLPADCVTTLASPPDFYAALLRGVASASAQVTLSALYLGTGALEVALAAALRDRLLAAPRLHLLAQFDHSRALRPTHPPPGAPPRHASSAALLLDLFRGADGAVHPALPPRVRVGLTLMPQLRGLWGALLPPRLREGAGVWHVKAYAFDAHTVLLSGANLSSDYFTTRQDRYVVVSSAGGAGGGAGEEGVARLAAYVHRCVGAVSRLPGSHVLLPSGRVEPVGGGGGGGRAELWGGEGTDTEKVAAAAAPQPPPLQQGLAPPLPLPPVTYSPLPRGSPLHAAFAAGLRALLLGASADAALRPEGGVPRGAVLVRPRWQLGSLGVAADDAALLALLRAQPPAARATLHLSTGYFNLPAPLQRALVGGARTCVHVLTAAPAANGFLGARGVAGAIPLAYSELERRFHDAAARAGRLMRDPEGAPGGEGVAIHEYARPGWTFHAKGLWLLPRGGGAGAGAGGEAAPLFTTVVGSSNYGERSLWRDLELQLEFTSSDSALRARLAAERDALWAPPWAGAVGAHLVGTAPGYGASRAVWDARAVPSRALQWRLAWANGVWIRAGCRLLARFF